MDRRPAQALGAFLLLSLPLLAREEKLLLAHWGVHPDTTACADPARPDRRWTATAIPDASPGCYRKRFTITAGERFALEFDGPPPAAVFWNGQPLAAPYTLPVTLNKENLLAIVAPAGLGTPVRLVKDPGERAPAVAGKAGDLRLTASTGPLPADRSGFAVVTANREGTLRWSVEGEGRLVGPATFGGVNLVRTTGVAGKITVTATTAEGERASVVLWSTAGVLGNRWLREPAR